MFVISSVLIFAVTHKLRRKTNRGAIPPNLAAYVSISVFKTILTKLIYLVSLLNKFVFLYSVEKTL